MLQTTSRAEDNAPPTIIMTSIADLYLASEAPKGANLVVRDSGRGSPLTDAELKASIYAKGILQPLIFKEDKARSGVSKFVVAGNRRLKALREIFADAPLTMVPTQNVDDFGGDWREIAMDTNLSLPPHLVERYEMIVALTKDLKLSPEDARLRFGMTPRQFDQVMALGKMSPLVRQAWKDGQIDAKTAQAFTLEPDTKEQDKIFVSLKKSDDLNNHQVRERIIPENQRDTGKFVNFIGVDICKQAKLIQQEDLFSSDHIVTDVKALKKLVDDRMNQVCADLIAGGWSWALHEDKLPESYWNYGSLPDRTKPEKYTNEQMAKAGCILKISNDGDLQIEYGRVAPAERRKVAASERAKEKAEKSGDEPALSNALAQRLSEQLQAAGAQCLKADHALSTAAIIAAISSGGHILDIRVGGASESRKPASFSDVFAGALKSTPQQREAMLAQIASQALSIVTFNGSGQHPLDDDATSDLFAAMNGPRVVKVIAGTFDAKDYFGSIGMQTIIAAVRCAMGDDHAEKVAKMKKPDAAKFAAANVPGKNWLPPQLRTPWYTGPIEDTEKDIKKSPAKKAAKKSAKK
jgi:ParB family transcriptional regulator, chromosome partitioning protein